MRSLSYRCSMRRARDGLTDFALQRAFAGEEEVARHLLGDRAGALAGGAGAQVHPGGARDADVIDAAVRVEPAVLGGDGGVAHVRGDVGEVHQTALFDEELGDQPFVAVVHLGDQAGLVILERRHVGQAGGQAAIRDVPRGACPGNAQQQQDGDADEHAAQQAATAPGLHGAPRPVAVYRCSDAGSRSPAVARRAMARPLAHLPCSPRPGRPNSRWMACMSSHTLRLSCGLRSRYAG